jgi:uncharacterized protein YggE
LVGLFQTTDLTIRDLSWQAAPDQAGVARREAAIKALTALRQEAAAAANALGLQIQDHQSIDLAPGPMLVMVQARSAGVMQMAATMPAPQATPDSLDIAASIAADVVQAAMSPHP